MPRLQGADRPRVQITVRLPEQLLADLDRRALDSHLSRNDLITLALAAHVDQPSGGPL